MRVLFTGQSGVRHDQARESLKNAIIENSSYREKDILSRDLGNVITEENNVNWFAFLESEDAEWQDRVCRDATEKVLNEIRSKNPDVSLISTHLCMFRKSRMFTPVDWNLIKEFSPNYAVTLIDDIYTIYSRIKSREESGVSTGSYMRLRELLTWRSIEILMTDRLVDYLNSHSGDSVNYVVSVKHPASMLYKLIFTSDPIVYAGSSLSEPRKSEEGIKGVNQYREAIHRNFPSFDPTTIDEGILNWKFFNSDNKLKDKYKGSEEVDINESDRFPIYFDGYEPLSSDRKDYPVKLRVEEVKEVAVPPSGQSLSDIENQIRSRDYRLIDQSDVMAGYRPYFHGKSSTGLTSELTYVKNNAHIPSVVVHKDEDGGWGGHPFSQSAIRTKRTEELVREIENM